MMRFLIQRGCCLLATAVFTLVGLHSAHADVIDNYSTNQPGLITFMVGPSVSNTVPSPAGSVASGFGDSRSMTIQQTVGGGVISALISGGEFGFGTGGATTRGQFHVDYNLSNNPLNLTTSTKITLGGNFDPSAAGTSLGVKLSDGVNMFTQAFTLTNPSPYSQDFLLSGFTGVNLGSITSISFGTYDSSGNLVNATPDADIRVNLFTSNGPATVVPEPASLAIWTMIGLVGAACGWRRRVV